MKRWKKLALVLVLVAVAGAAGVYVLRVPLLTLLARQVMGPFDPALAPPAPDYALESSWAALPTIEDPSNWTPSGFEEPENPLREQADVFFFVSFPSYPYSRSQVALGNALVPAALLSQR